MALPQSAPPSRQRGGGATPKEAVEAAKRLGGVFWWLIFGLMLVSDVGSVLSIFVVTVGLGATATLLGAVVGIPLVIVGWGAGVLISFNAFMFSTGYFWKNKVPLLQARKIATLGVSAIIEMVPYANLLPMLTFSFVIITLMENAKRGSGLVGAIGKKVVNRTPVGAAALRVAEKVL